MYNFDESARKWMQNYLRNHLQYEEIGVKQSGRMEIEQGVPQGSILGPLVYSIYTNRLPNLIKSQDCQDPSHRDQSVLFGINCRKCGSVPVSADDATFVVVNMEKTMILECMVKQKRTWVKGEPPCLSIQLETGELKTIHPEKCIHLLGINIEQNIAWNSHLSTG